MTGYIAALPWAFRFTYYNNSMPPRKNWLYCGLSALWMLSLVGCAAAPPSKWVRLDGNPATDQQFEIDSTICRGEMQKARLTAQPTDSVVAAYQRGKAEREVFAGCMAGHGYVLRPAE